ncbi:MAG TPA: lytic murein transglycosylase [Xanthobacteraceae bacterium]
MLRRWLAILVVLFVMSPVAQAADPQFQAFLQSLWPEAQRMGVSRPTFDAAIRGVEPDLSLPDLALTGRPERPPPQQPEFVQTPADYVRESSIARLAAEGKKLLTAHRATLDAIEKQFGVPPQIILAIWGRETAFGGYKLPHDALRALATQAYTGRRKDMFRAEFLAALKMLQDGVPRERMRSSWGGAMGLTQFLPSEYYKHAVDFDGDGRVDIWTSVPDALASAAKQLANKGWVRGERWAYEVRSPGNVDCTIAQPAHVLPVGEWLKRGYAAAHGRRLSDGELTKEASLLLPEGTYGPAFLTPKNYFVIKEYNFSDLYVLFVGHLSDRIVDGKPFEKSWSKNAQLRTEQVEAMQKTLTERGLYRDKVDGKAGMLTRAALGEYQKASGLKLDCWPTAAVVSHMQGRR